MDRAPDRETVLITGASSGIGRELAKLFAADGSAIVLTARSVDKLTDLAQSLRGDHGVEAAVLPYDLTDPSSPRSLWDELQRRGCEPDVLVNNAGFGELGNFAKSDLTRQLSMIQLNVTTLTHLTRLFLPGAVGRGRGGLLNVASTAAFQPGPNMAVYYATKAYVLSFTEALREELTGTGIHVCCLAPGPTETSFGADSGMDESLLFRSGAMDVSTVARAAYAGYRRNKSLIIPGATNWLGAFGVRFIPRSFVRKLVKRIQAVE